MTIKEFEEFQKRFCEAVELYNTELARKKQLEVEVARLTCAYSKSYGNFRRFRELEEKRSQLDRQSHYVYGLFKAFLQAYGLDFSHAADLDL
jgi:hypothetical protein